MSYRDHSAPRLHFGVAAIKAESPGTHASSFKSALRVASCLMAVVVSASCGRHQPGLLLTKPLRRDSVITHTYVCEIHPIQTTKILAPDRGYMEEVSVKEGQSLKPGDAMFKLLPQARNPDPKRTDAQETPRITTVTAPFAGQVGRLRLGKGSIVKKNEALTTLTDNSQIWAGFQMPEAHYQEYSTSAPADKAQQVKLILSNGKLFDQTGSLMPVEQAAEKTSGPVPLRALFPNPRSLLRPGQSGTIRIQNTLKNTLLVPLRATFEISGNRFVYVVDKEHVIRQKKISVTHEMEDLLVVTSGLNEDDTIILDGGFRVHEGEKATSYQFEEPAQAYAHSRPKK
ncbi:efflux RND transporter periplasmic adaptor subunit [Prosthecobacter sp.]|uniref:efflux RND transporter periplasmic adaptor subunit n=1 Tax=Prosthecobacter sp. TaxID=1965333 RepID=UPI003784D476